ncbi:MAG: DUF4258 domain-containing protein [Actinobacteria bacterium]|nr:DUF4258 domain-containing protein [Actinomycetota bacterium]MBW3651031.1 DUF4258 domain-containing protein [Actinomycetota bacterium]
MAEPLPRPEEWLHPKVISEHAFDKLGLLDCTLAEFELAIEHAEVIEETELPIGAKELVVTVEWKRALHTVVVVDEARGEERIVTVYEPDPERWSADYRRRG